MEQNDQQRRAAAENFLKSLDELEDILNQDSFVEEEKTLPKSPHSHDVDDAKIDLSVWEDAVADIEQYLENKNKHDR